ncbi:hypothetical protein ANCDUO_14287 [Ancylostoma duodenale]|uniref:SXP/RAL-2 family protein Ani s 5-like cation-binding domain-containing protein n=1 Tax=Ancylostoma duodenale TaxID=51022 RepID=A0A0C2G3M9_9BILA|nr:hypothetical protein ANCDUO_14287 [Ancylostoma duodenale]
MLLLLLLEFAVLTTAYWPYYPVIASHLTMIRLQDKYDAYKKDIEKQTIKAQQELDGALNALPKYFTQLRNIENNMTLTAAQAAQEKKELFKTLTPKEQRAAESLEDIFAPDYAKMPPPGPYGPGPYGPGSYGPGPYGPGPYGPAPYGPYGPYGSYGHCM